MAFQYVLHRVGYDLDGTRGYVRDPSTQIATPISSVDLASLNTTHSTILSLPDSQKQVILVFADPIRVDAIMIYAAGSAGVVEVQYSASDELDVDGDWVTVGNLQTYTGSLYDATFLGASSAIGFTGKSLRLNGLVGSSYGYGMIHVFGEYQPYDRLSIFNYSADNSLPVPSAQFGDVGRGSTQDTRFRVKNHSKTLTATNVMVDSEFLLPSATPSPEVQFLFSVDDGISFQGSASIPSLSPTQISREIILRRVTPAAADEGQFMVRLHAEAGSWS